MIDWEAELAVVIGWKAYNVRGDAALAAIAGYSVFNDISSRDWNVRPTPVGIDWVLGKAANGSAPMGPFITPARFVEEPQKWNEQNTPILLLFTLRSEALAMDLHLSARFADARRILPFIEVTLQPLSQQEVLHLTEAIIDEVVEDDLGRKRKSSHPASSGSNASENVSAPQNLLVHLARLLFEQTGGQPLYLMETFKLLLDRQRLVPKLSPDGTSWRFILMMELPEAFTQQVQQELLAPSIRTMILARLSTLSVPARQLLMAAAILGNLATAKHVWLVADLSPSTGLEALEEAVKSGLLREMEAWRGRMDRYRFAHVLERDIIYTEIGEARRHFLHLRALEILTSTGVHAAELAYHAMEAGEIEAAYRYSIQTGDDAVTVFAVKEAIVYYEQARTLLQNQREQTMEDYFQDMSSSRSTIQDRADQTYPHHFPLIEHLYTSLSHAYTFLQEEGQAMQMYEELLAHARQQHNFSLISDILNRLAMMSIHRHAVEPRVEALVQEAVLMADRSGDKRVQTITALGLAQIATITP